MIEDESSRVVEHSNVDNSDLSSLSLPDAAVGDDDDESDGCGFNGGSSVPVSMQLREWCTEYDIHRTAVNKLLCILKPVCPSLPLDARTLLQTPRQVEVKSLDKGVYAYLGLADGLQRALVSEPIADNEEVHVQVNVDGLPLFKSSNIQIWPILCLIKKPYVAEPFVVQWTVKATSVFFE